jgi:hypothetical protein
VRVAGVGHCGPPFDPLKGRHSKDIDIVEASRVDAKPSSPVEVDVACLKSAIEQSLTSNAIL